MIDGSSSVGEGGFRFIQSFLSNILAEFQNIGGEGVEIAVIQYSDTPR